MTGVGGGGHDLVVRAGRIVTDRQVVEGDLAVDDGVISQIGGPMLGRREIDARGRLVVPGGVDMHVHLTTPRGVEWRWVDDFGTGSAAAAAGGVTSIGNMTECPPDRPLLEGLAHVDGLAASAAFVDYTLHPIIEEPTAATLRELGGLADHGYGSIKVFTLDDAFSDRWCDAVVEAGRQGLVTMAHCEDDAINRAAERRLAAEGRDDVSTYPDSRPAEAEAAAVARMLALAGEARAPIHLVHLSSALALDAVRAARRRGQRVWVESRPTYLHLSRERYDGPDGARYVCFPPLRAAADRVALWSALCGGEIDTIASDHAPLDRRQILDPRLRVGSFIGAMPGLETLRPLLFHEGVVSGRISLHQWVDLTATAPARIFGMYPRKGSLSEGADADLVIWDPDRVRVVHAGEMRSASDFDVYEGREVRGWPAVTVVRGEVVFRDGEIVGSPGHGRRIPRRRVEPDSVGSPP